MRNIQTAVSAHTHIENCTHVYMNLFTRNSPYYHLLKYLLFLLKHPVYGGQSVSGRGFCPFTSITPCQYQSSGASYSLSYHRRYMTSPIYSVVTLHTPSVVPAFRVLEVTLLKCLPVFGQATKGIFLSSVELFD